MGKAKELSVEELYHRCDPSQFSFRTTADLDGPTQMVGQVRAKEAMKFGVGIGQDGYNIFALGPAGTGKRAFVREFFEERARDQPVPPDWCYVNNFDEPHRPKAIQLPAGMGTEFRNDMDHLVEELRTALAAAFESEEYQNRRQAINDEFGEQQSRAFDELQQRAQEEGVALIRTPAGLVLAPVHDGEVLSPQEIQNLSENERQALQKKIEELQVELQKILRQVPGWQQERREKLNQLNREMAEFAVGGLIGELLEKYSDFQPVVDHLKVIQEDVVKNAEDFLPSQGQEPSSFLEALQGGAGQQAQAQQAALRRYKVNLLVDHSESKGAPVIYEDNPTYQNLVGRIEHMAQLGALLTDFNLIKPGALHRANGGYLILDVRKVLTEPYTWEGLKRALQSGRIRIESLGQMLSLISTVSLEPEDIPLKVKVALFGDRMLYYALYSLDPEFGDLFKVAADFEERMDRNENNQQLYAQLIASLTHEQKLRPFDRTAVARVIEHSSRIVEDSAKLSAQVREISNLLQEANYWAGESGNGVVEAADVQRAIDAQIYRSDRMRERVQEAILRDILLIDSKGATAGQVNGLSVMQLGNFSFGRPSRITAQVHMGGGEVVDIEREVKLGGPIHSKGVMILSGFLSARYTRQKPLSLTATLVFEQSYGGVEGDSASSAELYALLSAIAEVPIKQSLAVTGSVNQHGQVQAIGGVNEKIEGFFDVCRARGLTGDQGVLIPVSNVGNLMLRQDVRDAVEGGQFHIYSVESVDQGIEILTGVPAGEPDEEGDYPEGTINHMVESRLTEMAEKRRAFSAAAKEGES